MVSKEIKTVLQFLEFTVKCAFYESLPDLCLILPPDYVCVHFITIKKTSSFGVGETCNEINCILKDVDIICFLKMKKRKPYFKRK